MTKINNKKALYAIAAIATLIGITAIAPAFATHYASNRYPSYSPIERIPDTATDCSSDGKTCARVFTSGVGETYATAPGAFESKTATARLNQNQALNSVGSPPQVTTTETPTIGIAFEVYVTYRGKIEGSSGNAVMFKLGGQTWKLVSGSYQKDQVFSKDITGDGVKSGSDKARGLFSVGPGTYRLGGQVFSIAQHYFGGTPKADFFYSDAGGDYKATVDRLAICHPASSTAACPT